MKKIEIVVGSWGSYNECNERALGSKWLNLGAFGSWEEIKEELIAQGFELDGIDEELFIQDISEDLGFECDYMHPKKLFEILNESNVLNDEYDFEKMLALIEAYGWNDFEELVESFGNSWGDDITLYYCYDWEDFGRQMFEEMGYELPDGLENYFDFEAYGEAFEWDGYTMTEQGILFRY